MSRSFRSVGRLTTNPIVPSLEWSQMNVTVRAKLASASAGMAMRKWLASVIAGFMRLSISGPARRLTPLLCANDGFVEFPGAGNVQDIGFATHLGRERRERAGELNDAHGGVIEQFLAGGTQHRDGRHRAVGLERDIEHQATGQVAALGLLGIIQVADALDL